MQYKRFPLGGLWTNGYLFWDEGKEAFFVDPGGDAREIPPEAILPIPAEAYPLPARRPRNSRLDTGKLRTAFGLALPDWHAGVLRTLTEILKQ